MSEVRFLFDKLAPIPKDLRLKYSNLHGSLPRELFEMVQFFSQAHRNIDEEFIIKYIVPLYGNFMANKNGTYILEDIVYDNNMAKGCNVFTPKGVFITRNDLNYAQSPLYCSGICNRYSWKYGGKNEALEVIKFGLGNLDFKESFISAIRNSSLTCQQQTNFINLCKIMKTELPTVFQQYIVQ